MARCTAILAALTEVAGLCETPAMITAAHALIYADDPVAARKFFQEVFGLPTIDAGEGWLIFKLPPAELGVHPTDGGPISSNTMRLSFICDDIETTTAELAAKGAEILSAPVNAGYGTVATIKVPGGATVDVYQPRHATAFDLAD
jgi:predicted enzyme related to lactoylglutathione lyase